MMRVTQSIFFKDSVSALQKRMVQLHSNQQESLTGNRIQSPTDDPAGVFRHTILSSDLAGVEALQRTTNLSSSRIALAAQKLDIVHENFLDAQELALTMGNDYQGDANTMRGLSYKADHIFNQMLQNINTEADGMPLFAGGRTVVPYDNANPMVTDVRLRAAGTGGFATQSSADYQATNLDTSNANYPGSPSSIKLTFDAASNSFAVSRDGVADPASPVAFGGAPATLSLGWVDVDVNVAPADQDAFFFEVVPQYQGGLQDPSVKVADGKTLPGNMTGEEVMEGKNGRGNNLFAIVAGLRGALNRADPREVNAWLGQLEEARSQVTDTEAVSGLRQVQIEAITETLDIESVSLQDVIAKNREADMFEVLSRIEQDLQALQVMTTSERNILNVSLVDLLR